MFTIADSQSFALNKPTADSETAIAFANFVEATQEAYPNDSLQKHWDDFCQAQLEAELDM